MVQKGWGEGTWLTELEIDVWTGAGVSTAKSGDAWSCSRGPGQGLSSELLDPTGDLAEFLRMCYGVREVRGSLMARRLSGRRNSPARVSGRQFRPWHERI